MNVVLALVAGLLLFGIVFTLTDNRLIAAAALASPALLNLSLWTIRLITGAGPGGFIPHWVAALVVTTSVVFLLLVHWADEEKEV